MSRNTALVIPFFILVALSILFLSHDFIYFSAVHFFGILSTSRKAALAFLLFLLPASFIASSILAHWSANRLSTVLYFFSGLWLGVGLTLMMFFAAAWAAWGAVKLLAHSPGPGSFGAAAVAIACLYSGYGVWNAYHPRTENVRVKIRNLPPEWQGKKIVQLSDVHLGRILGAPFLARLVAQVNAQNPDIVFITGDLFDGAEGGLEDLVLPLNDLRAPRGIYYVTGNHETYLGVARALAALKKTRVRVLNDELAVVNSLQIIGISYPERGHSKDIGEVIRNLSDFDPRKPSVLLYHNPTQVEAAKAAGVSLQLSGHTHHGQVLPIQLISRLIYGKYYYGLHVEGDYALYASSGAGTWGPTMRTGNHPEIAVIQMDQK